MDQGGERPAVEGTACVSFNQRVLAKTLNKANVGDVRGRGVVTKELHEEGHINICLHLRSCYFHFNYYHLRAMNAYNI